MVSAQGMVLRQNAVESTSLLQACINRENPALRSEKYCKNKEILLLIASVYISKLGLAVK